MWGFFRSILERIRFVISQIRSRLFLKTLVIIITVWGMVAIMTSVLSGWLIYDSLLTEFENNGTAIAQSVSDAGLDLFIQNPSEFSELLTYFGNIRSIAYILIQDERMRIVTHTFPGEVPPNIALLPRQKDQRIIASYSIPGVGKIIEIAVPVLNGPRNYVVVGFYETFILRHIYVTLILQNSLIFSLFVLSVFLAHVLINRISKPLGALTEYAAKLGHNQWDAWVSIRTQDEVGLLAKTMAEMAHRLQHVFDNLQLEIDSATRKLRDQNEELKATLEKVQSMQKQIVLQEKLASLGSLTAGISHEIKNPLNFVTNFSDLSLQLLKELDPLLKEAKPLLPSKTYEEMTDISQNLVLNAQKIAEHGKRADSVVTAMQRHAQGRSSSFETVSFNGFVKDAVKLAYSGYITTSPFLKFHLQEDYDPVISNVRLIPQDISRVIINICTNAFYALHQKIEQNPDSDFVPCLTVITHNAGPKVILKVRDNGIGIPAAIQDKVFEPFFTTKPPGEGTGLGLSICFELITQAHQGSISVASVENDYTEFTIQLPKNL